MHLLVCIDLFLPCTILALFSPKDEFKVNEPNSVPKKLLVVCGGYILFYESEKGMDQCIPSQKSLFYIIQLSFFLISHAFLKKTFCVVPRHMVRNEIIIIPSSVTGIHGEAGDVRCGRCMTDMCGVCVR